MSSLCLWMSWADNVCIIVLDVFSTKMFYIAVITKITFWPDGVIEKDHWKMWGTLNVIKLNGIRDNTNRRHSTGHRSQGPDGGYAPPLIRITLIWNRILTYSLQNMYTASFPLLWAIESFVVDSCVMITYILHNYSTGTVTNIKYFMPKTIIRKILSHYRVLYWKILCTDWC